MSVEYDDRITLAIKSLKEREETQAKALSETRCRREHLEQSNEIISHELDSPTPEIVHPVLVPPPADRSDLEKSDAAEGKKQYDRSRLTFLGRQMAYELVELSLPKNAQVITHAEAVKHTADQAGKTRNDKNMRMVVWTILNDSGLFRRVERGNYQLVESEVPKLKRDLDTDAGTGESAVN